MQNVLRFWIELYRFQSADISTCWCTKAINQINYPLFNINTSRIRFNYVRFSFCFDACVFLNMLTDMNLQLHTLWPFVNKIITAFIELNVLVCQWVCVCVCAMHANIEHMTERQTIKLLQSFDLPFNFVLQMRGCVTNVHEIRLTWDMGMCLRRWWVCVCARFILPANILL